MTIVSENVIEQQKKKNSRVFVIIKEVGWGAIWPISNCFVFPQKGKQLKKFMLNFSYMGIRVITERIPHGRLNISHDYIKFRCKNLKVIDIKFLRDEMKQRTYKKKQKSLKQVT